MLPRRHNSKPSLKTPSAWRSLRNSLIDDEADSRSLLDEVDHLARSLKLSNLSELLREQESPESQLHGPQPLRQRMSSYSRWEPTTLRPQRTPQPRKAAPRTWRDSSDDDSGQEPDDEDSVGIQSRRNTQNLERELEFIRMAHEARVQEREAIQIAQAARKRETDRQRALAAVLQKMEMAEREVRFALPADASMPTPALDRGGPMDTPAESTRTQRVSISGSSVHRMPVVDDVPGKEEEVNPGAVVVVESKEMELQEDLDARSEEMFEQLKRWDQGWQKKAARMREDVLRAEEKAAKIEEEAYEKVAKIEEEARKKAEADRLEDERRADVGEQLDKREAQVKAKEDMAAEMLEDAKKVRQEIIEDAQKVRQEVDDMAEDVRKKEKDVLSKEEQVLVQEEAAQLYKSKLQAQGDALRAKEEDIGRTEKELAKTAGDLQEKKDDLQRAERFLRAMADELRAKEKELKVMDDVLREKEAELQEREEEADEKQREAHELREGARQETETANLLQEEARKRREVLDQTMLDLRRWEADLRKREDDGRKQVSEVSMREVIATRQVADVLVRERRVALGERELENKEARIVAREERMEKSLKRREDEVQRREDAVRKRTQDTPATLAVRPHRRESPRQEAAQAMRAVTPSTAKNERDAGSELKGIAEVLVRNDQSSPPAEQHEIDIVRRSHNTQTSVSPTPTGSEIVTVSDIKSVTSIISVITRDMMSY